MFDKKNECQGNNEPSLYCETRRLQEVLANKFENVELNAIADARMNNGQSLIRVNLEIEGVVKRERNAVYRVAAKR